MANLWKEMTAEEKLDWLWNELLAKPGCDRSGDAPYR